MTSHIDPVCGMPVDPATAVSRMEHDGEWVYFCSFACNDRFVADPGAYRSGKRHADHACCHAHAPAPPPGAPAIWVSLGFGVLASGGLLGLYFGLLTLLSGWSFTLDQFVEFWPYLAMLAAGFGIQVGLFTYLRRAVRAAQSAKVVAVTGTASGTAMVSCCAHYLVNLLPALGATGLVSLVSQYQVELFWFGIAANLAGITYVGRRLVHFLHGDSAMERRIASLVIIAGFLALTLPDTAAAGPYPSQTNKEGQVSVEVTPVALAPADREWRFEVRLDTHSVALEADMASVATLTTPGGAAMNPVAWEGDPADGHHRKGSLVFKPVTPAPEAVTLTLRDIGPVPARSFTWSLIPR